MNIYNSFFLYISNTCNSSYTEGGTCSSVKGNNSSSLPENLNQLWQYRTFSDNSITYACAFEAGLINSCVSGFTVFLDGF